MSCKSGNFIIESGIPLPELSRSLYPWAALKIGDSFFCPGMPEATRKGMSSNARRFGIKVATRMENGGIRIWRIA